jgi:hypothetical protein
VNELDEVRREVAAQRGLSVEAAGFLVGQNLEEIEESADALGRLMAEHAEPEPEQPEAANIFAVASAAKIARQRAIVQMFSGRATRQPRDQAGRFTFAMDGGFRGPAVTPRSDPDGDHGRLVLRLARARALGAGFPGQ